MYLFAWSSWVVSAVFLFFVLFFIPILFMCSFIPWLVLFCLHLWFSFLIQLSYMFHLLSSSSSSCSSSSSSSFFSLPQSLHLITLCQNLSVFIGSYVFLDKGFLPKYWVVLVLLNVFYYFSPLSNAYSCYPSCKTALYSSVHLKSKLSVLAQSSFTLV